MSKEKFSINGNKLLLSAVILTKNEENNIKACINSLRFCNEVIVIDDNSTDKTIDMARKESAYIYRKSLNKNYSEQNNYALRRASNDWVLFVDADERISKDLAEEIINILKENKNIYAFSIPRIDYFLGQWVKYGEVGAFRSIRLVKKGSGKWVRRVHQGYETKGVVGELKNPILHYPHPTLFKFIENVNRWSGWHAIANKEEGKKSGLLKIILYPAGHFVRNYIFRFGFRDNVHGFIYALLMAIHSYLSWSKLYLLQKGYKKI